MRIAICAVTLEELEFGFSSKPQPDVRKKYAAILEHMIDVLPVTSEIAIRAGALRAGHRRSGRTRGQADMLIAATAAIHGLTLVTRNVRDFEGCGIKLLNPWT
jgi:predicted nucleic acid-binding protein